MSALSLPDPFPPHYVHPDAEPTKVPMKHLPQLSIAERDRRWDGLRKRMLMAGIDVLVFLGNDIYWDMGLANLRYVTNAADKVACRAVFFIDADPVMYTSVAHMNRPYSYLLSTQDWVEDIRSNRGLIEIAGLLTDRAFDRSCIGLVGFSSTIQSVPTLLQGEVETMKSQLPNARFTDASWILEQMRLVKSEEELGLMREAGRIARKVVDAMLSTAAPGCLEAELYAEMIRTQIANGGEPNIFNLFASGPVEHDETEMWHLLHGVDQPGMPTMRPLAEGDLVVAEWHTKYGGYLVHTEYSVYLGDPPPKELTDLFSVAVECLDVSRDILTPGRTLRDAWEAIRKPCEKAGYDFVELGFHAMGLASPEFPTVIYRPGYGSNDLNGHNIGDLVLEEGMTFGNNIDLFNPAWKPDVGIMFSDFMVVKPGGAELLIGTPRELGIASELGQA